MATQMFSQALPQSTPATPTHTHFLFPPMQKQPVAKSTHSHSLSTQKKNTHTTPQLQNMSTRNSVATPLPITAPSPPPTTVMSQIPTSLQRLVHANLSATTCTVQQPLPSSQGPSASSSSSSPKSSNTTNSKPSPVPLSISYKTGLNGKQTDDIGPTPLTPLSPYCGQQGIYILAVEWFVSLDLGMLVDTFCV